MALLTNKIVTITAESKIGDETVVRMSATINSKTDVNTAYNETIMNTELYNENKPEIRGDMVEFRNQTFIMEDRLERELVLDQAIDTNDLVLENAEEPVEELPEPEPEETEGDEEPVDPEAPVEPEPTV